MNLLIDAVAALDPRYFREYQRRNNQIVIERGAAQRPQEQGSIDGAGLEKVQFLASAPKLDILV
jgi:hypothetical protein